jgi:hypothetical protein
MRNLMEGVTLLAEITGSGAAGGLVPRPGAR